jgi:hypothetical protein
MAGIVKGSLRDEVFQCLDVAAVIAGFLDGSFRDESGVSEARVIQQHSKRLDPDGSFADLLMPVKLRTARCSGIIAVPDFNPAQADGCIELLQRLIHAFFADNVISSHVRMASIDAGSDGSDSA